MDTVDSTTDGTCSLAELQEQERDLEVLVAQLTQRASELESRVAERLKDVKNVKVCNDGCIAKGCSYIP